MPCELASLRAKGVEVIAEKPVGVFRLLVREERSLTFRPAEEGALTTDGTVSDDDLAQPGDDLNGAARHKDLRLQTACASAQLQTRLLATFHAARTSMEEQGVNTLYLALGMLSWSEGGRRREVLSSPIDSDRSRSLRDPMPAIDFTSSTLVKNWATTCPSPRS